MLEVLRRRYLGNEVYTAVGQLLVAINPQKPIPRLYDSQALQRHLQRREGAAPHIFSLAREAYHGLLQERHSQSILIAGESGSGKTEATKHVLSFLTYAAASRNANASDRVPVQRSRVEEQIVGANPILEAFGNAKTVRNDNSSRFGKYTKVFFAPSGAVSGCAVAVYLLEKVRVVRQSPQERNYHVFYQLLAGASPEERKALRLLPPSRFRYLSHPGTVLQLADVDDAADLRRLRSAFQTLGFSAARVADVFRALAAVLHLGNVSFSPAQVSGNEGCRVADREPLETAATLLAVPPEDLERALCSRSMGSASRSSVYSIPLKVSDAEASRDALAKALYELLFLHLVGRINAATRPVEEGLFIGVLDIFGFEAFDSNGFEQLLINFANDKLFAHFNREVFAAEIEDHQREGLSLAASLSFPSNQQLLDLLEQRSSGLLPLLDEESRLPKGSDAGFLDKVHRQWLSCAPVWQRPVKALPTQFCLGHFAGSVTYTSGDFLEKNRDLLHADLSGCLSNSLHPFFPSLLSDSSASSPSPSFSSSPSSVSSPSTASSSRKSKATLSEQFRSSLQGLLTELQATTPWFVRAFKPNTLKQPDLFDQAELLRQIHNVGLLSVVAIRRAGFPHRLPYALFLRRYSRCPSFSSSLPSSDSASRLLAAAAVPPSCFALGRTKVFLKDAAKRALVEALNRHLAAAAVVIQKHFRRLVARRRYLVLLQAERQRRAQAEQLRRQQEAEQLRRQEEQLRLQQEQSEQQRVALLEAQILQRRQEEEDRLLHLRREFERQEQIAQQSELLLQQHQPSSPPIAQDYVPTSSIWSSLLVQSGPLSPQSPAAAGAPGRPAAPAAPARKAMPPLRSAGGPAMASSDQILSKHALPAELRQRASSCVSGEMQQPSPHRLELLRDQFSGLRRTNTCELLDQAKRHHRTRSVSDERPPAEVSQSDPKMEKLRSQVVLEIHRTEEDYVRDLVHTIDFFLHPLQQAKGELKITEGDLKVVFSSLENLIPINRVVLDRLKETLSRPFPQQSVGAVFVSLGDYLLVYSDYCTNQTAACDHLKRLTKKNKRLAAFLEKQRKENPELRGLSLEDFLIKPLQRITRYPLLLRELARNTGEGHTDWLPLEGAMQKIQKLVGEINERSRQAENNLRLGALLKAFEKGGSDASSFVQPTSRFLKEIDVKVVDEAASGALKKRKLVLFSDQVVLAKPKGSKTCLQFLSSVPIGRLDVDTVSLSECEYPHAFMVVRLHPSGDAERNDFFVCVALNEPARQQWVARVSEAIDAATRAPSAPESRAASQHNLALLESELARCSPARQAPPRPLHSSDSAADLIRTSTEQLIAVATDPDMPRYNTVRRNQFMNNLRQLKAMDCAATSSDSNIAAPMNRRN